MSEYMEKHSVARLIGSPPGYVGYVNSNPLQQLLSGRHPFDLI
jgi:ATP-dependent Clp protease ATP-binding subunit ClpE